MNKALTPIIILGAPRSGTTLLRVLLGQHPRIVALPETPWVGGGYTPYSIRGLENFLIEYEKGSVKTLGSSAEHIQLRLRDLLYTTLFDNPLVQEAQPEADFVVIKTPDDSAYPDFYFRNFPNAFFIHLIRDGRDVAFSTLDAFASCHEVRMLGLSQYLLTYGNAIQRWIDMEEQISAITRLTDRLVHIRYEELVLQPNRILNQFTDILGIENLADWRHYSKSTQPILPDHERGAQDVRQQQSVSTASNYRWPSLLDPLAAREVDRRWGRNFEDLGYPRSNSVCPLYLDKKNPLYIKNAAAIDCAMPFSRFAFRPGAWPSFLRDTLTDIRKVLARHYYKHLCADTRETS